MGKPNFTPGPWRMVPDSESHSGPDMYTVKAKGRHNDCPIAEVYNDMADLSPRLMEGYAVAEANARLIGAAPELLGALEAMIIQFSEWQNHSQYAAIVHARAAIAKATEAA